VKVSWFTAHNDEEVSVKWVSYPTTLCHTTKQIPSVHLKPYFRTKTVLNRYVMIGAQTQQLTTLEAFLITTDDDTSTTVIVSLFPTASVYPFNQIKYYYLM